MNTHTEKCRFSVLLFFVLSLFTVSCNKDKSPERTVFSFQGKTMGTTYQVKIISQDDLDRDELTQGIAQQLETVNSLMSNWVADSEVSRFNQLAVGESIALGEHTLAVLNRALEIAQLTGGILDPTVGPLVELWGFGTSDGLAFPSDEEIAAAKEKTGYEKLKLEGNLLYKTTPGLSLNLSSLAKGYGTDLVCKYLDEKGFTNYLVNVGGDGRVRGLNPSAQPWRLAIEAPDSARLQGIYKVTQLLDVAMATSGDYRNFFDYKGQRYSHLIDPRTGRPILSRITSVSIVAPNCMTADALATALSIMDPKEGIKLVEGMQGVECFLILRDQDGNLSEAMSSGMNHYLTSLDE